MPMQQGKGKGLGNLIKTHAMDQTEEKQDFSRLPGGITGGVAELVAAQIGVYKQGKNQGQQFLRLAASVIEPVETMEVIKGLEDGINPVTKKPQKVLKILSSQKRRVFGLQTSIMLPLCETKDSKSEATSAEDNVATALNEVRLIGGDSCLEGVEDEESLKAVLQALVRSDQGHGCYVRFSTQTPDPTEQYPNPITFERWYGSKGLESYSPNGELTSDMMVDQSATEAATKEDVPQSDTGEPTSEEATTPQEVTVEYLAQLVEQAKDPDNEDARATLKSLAMEAGMSEEDVDNAASWEDVAAIILPPEEPAAEPEPAIPAKGEVWGYKPIDPKTKKPVKKAIEVQVIAVDKRTKTATCLNNDNRKTVYKAVKWDDLEII